jgi:hypothetical protein
MDEERLLIEITEAMNRIRATDLNLLANNLSERCVASRLAMYLQERIPQFMVDIEYNRKGAVQSDSNCQVNTRMR